MTYIEIVEECEHGWEGSPFNHPPQPAQVLTGNETICPGGSRTRLTRHEAVQWIDDHIGVPLPLTKGQLLMVVDALLGAGSNGLHDRDWEGSNE